MKAGKLSKMHARSCIWAGSWQLCEEHEGD
jgi:hypothetical protein